MRTVYAQKNKKIILGRQGEDKAVRVVWPGIVSDWSSLYGDGSFQLSVRRFGEENTYPVVVEVSGDDIRFTVTSAETAIAGSGKCELTYIANGTIAKSATWETVVLNSLTGQTPSEPPEEPAKSWFTSIQGQIGNLADLATSSKDNLVAAINEAAQSGGGGASVELDTTLTQSGKAADAKAVGDALAEKQPKGDYLTQNELPDMTAYRTAEAQDVIDAGKQGTLIQSGASVGQIAKITAVDESGKPTAWEAADISAGGGWELITDITLTEDGGSANQFNVTSNDKGEDFEYRQCMVCLSGKVVDGWPKGAYISLELYESNKLTGSKASISLSRLAAGAGGTDYKTTVEISIFGNLVRIIACGGSSDTSSLIMRSDTSIDTFRSIKMSCYGNNQWVSVPLAAGGRVVIYGRK